MFFFNNLILKYMFRNFRLYLTQFFVNNVCDNDDVDKISDAYHSFEELYEFRKTYNAALFNEWFSQGKYDIHKSKRHFDGAECFGGGWFIVVAMLPTGQISQHYRLEDFDLFKVSETEKALFEFDGHTSEDVLVRLRNF